MNSSVIVYFESCYFMFMWMKNHWQIQCNAARYLPFFCSKEGETSNVSSQRSKEKARLTLLNQIQYRMNCKRKNGWFAFTLKSFPTKLVHDAIAACPLSACPTKSPKSLDLAQCQLDSHVPTVHICVSTRILPALIGKPTAICKSNEKV